MDASKTLVEFLLPKLVAEVACWRLPRGVELADLLQEACVRWIQHQASGQGLPANVEVGSLLGIARNVLRERRRSVMRWQRLLAKLACRQLERAEVDVVDHGAELRSAFHGWLAKHMDPLDAEVFLRVRWDGMTWTEAGVSAGWAGEALVEARRRKILRIVSGEGFKKSFAQWLELSGLPFPSLPFPSLHHDQAPCCVGRHGPAVAPQP
jgi:hypothetical protein